MNGFMPWLMQRITAIYMALYMPVALFIIISGMPWHFIEWQTLFANVWVALATLLFFLALLFHAWVGLRDVIIDYINWMDLRLVALSLVALFLLVNALWVVKILWF